MKVSIGQQLAIWVKLSIFFWFAYIFYVIAFHNNEPPTPFFNMMCDKGVPLISGLIFIALIHWLVFGGLKKAFRTFVWISQAALIFFPVCFGTFLVLAYLFKS